VPGFPPPLPPPPPPPPQPITPIVAKITINPSVDNQLRRRLGTRKNAISARAVPPVTGPMSLHISFLAVAAVVVTVRVVVCAVVPLMVTEAGFRLHAGMSFTPVIVVTV